MNLEQTTGLKLSSSLTHIPSIHTKALWHANLVKLIYPSAQRTDLTHSLLNPLKANLKTDMSIELSVREHVKSLRNYYTYTNCSYFHRIFTTFISHKVNNTAVFY